MSVDLVVSAQEPVVSMKGFKELKVWQRSKSLVSAIYKLTAMFPEHEKFGLTNQMRRCSVSVPSNIAEGHARTRKDFSRFLHIAYGSLNELETQLEIACDLDFVEEKKIEPLLNEIQEIGKMINGLKRSLTDA